MPIFEEIENHFDTLSTNIALKPTNLLEYRKTQIKVEHKNTTVGCQFLFLIENFIITSICFLIFQNVWDSLRRGTVRVKDADVDSGAGGQQWTELDRIVEGILGPDSAYLGGMKNPDNPPQFPSNDSQVNPDDETSDIGFIEDEVLSIAGNEKNFI